MPSVMRECTTLSDGRYPLMHASLGYQQSRPIRLGWCLSLLLGVLYLFAGDVRNARANGATVDLALVLGIDISRSVNDEEYRLQRRGLAEAIENPEVLAAIKSGQLKRIAVTVVQWTDFEAQIVSIPWKIISNERSAARFARSVRNMVRFYGGHGTHISGMIAFGTALLKETPFTAARKVIDVSGDGHDNVTNAPGRRRDEAVASGITINGLAIENEQKELRHYYREFVIGGPGAFVMRLQRYEDFGEAMKKKLIREISPKMLSLNDALFGAG